MKRINSLLAGICSILREYSALGKYKPFELSKSRIFVVLFFLYVIVISIINNAAPLDLFIFLISFLPTYIFVLFNHKNLLVLFILNFIAIALVKTEPVISIILEILLISFIFFDIPKFINEHITTKQMDKTTLRRFRIILGTLFFYCLFIIFLKEQGFTSILYHPLNYLLFFSFIYFIPSIMAYGSNNSEMKAIFIINLFLGWTIFGWFKALSLAIYNYKEIIKKEIEKVNKKHDKALKGKINLKHINQLKEEQKSEFVKINQKYDNEIEKLKKGKQKILKEKRDNLLSGFIGLKKKIMKYLIDNTHAEKPIYAYEIKKYLDNNKVDNVLLDMGQLSRTLKSLEKDKYIKRKPNGRKKKISLSEESEKDLGLF